jgi:hypothetical protein
MESLGINSNVHTGMQCTRIQLPARCSYKPTVCVSVLCSRLKRSCRRLTSSLGHLQFQSMPLRISGELDTAWRESQMIDRRRQLSMQQARTRSIVCSARCRLVSGCRGRSSTLARRASILFLQVSRYFAFVLLHLSIYCSLRSESQWGTLFLSAKGLARPSAVSARARFILVGTLSTAKALSSHDI